MEAPGTAVPLLSNYNNAYAIWPADPISFETYAESTFTGNPHYPLTVHPGQADNWETCPSQAMQSSDGIAGLGGEYLDLSQAGDPYLALPDWSYSDEYFQASASHPLADVVDKSEDTNANSGVSTVSRNADEPFSCPECHEGHDDYSSLLRHGHEMNHRIYGCHNCDFMTQLHSDYFAHIQEVHSLLTCQDCGIIFGRPYELDRHIVLTKHSAYRCNVQGCGQTFSRLDTYKRHTILHQDTVRRYPCPHCKTYQGSNGFKRKDHLTQHLRNYHHTGKDIKKSFRVCFCPHDGCPEHRASLSWNPDAWPFKSSAEYRTHMKKVHNESPYPCSEPGCGRVDGNGYFRERDLVKHRKKEHFNGRMW